MADHIETLLAELTLEEKVSMLAGADLWHTVPVPRLGIPAIKLTDGPNGARGSANSGGPTSVCFPVGVALGATWNVDLVRQVGEALADEVQAKGAHMLLAPTVNIHRCPLTGRHFECYSEDPLLTGRLATAYIQGMQSKGVSACIKHFVCNDSEFERKTISSEVGDRALREVYLAPFRMAIRDAQPWAVMSAYNKLNGTWCSENARLLLGILKDEWGFDGIVVSDWYGTETPNVARGGLDLEMPGPARWMGPQVLDAVRSGQLAEAMIDDKVRRLLRTIERVGALEQPELRPEQAIDRPEHRQLVRRAAAEAAVLLKNERAILPLDPRRVRSIGVIGENACVPPIQGGGSAHVSPHYTAQPYDAIVASAASAARAGAGVEVGYELGCAVHRMIPILPLDWVTPPERSGRGLTLSYFNSGDLSGEPVHSAVVEQADFVWFGMSLPYVNAREFSVRLSGTLTPPQTGRYSFDLSSTGPSRLLIDGAMIVDNWAAPETGGRALGEIELAGGRGCRLDVEFAWSGEGHWRSLRVGCAPAVPPDAIERAVALAARSDVAIVFAGTSDEWESEGYDRQEMELPGAQDTLIERVAAANPNTVVVLNTGSPVPMPWLDRVAAVLQAWFPGQEAGNAIADVLFGDANPSGKLPTTFPRRLQDTPAYINYPGENGRVLYGEGLFVGYRYYDKKQVEPLFPFGHGLSYTTFAYANLALDAAEYGPDDEIGVAVDVQNTGARAGQEVVQVYVRDVQSSLVRPEKELKAFAKVMLRSGETQTVRFVLGRDALAFYDPAAREWVVEPGEFEVLVGGSSRVTEATLRARFTVKRTGGAAEQAARLHIGLPIKELLDDPAARAVLRKHVPEVLDAPELNAALDMTLEQVAHFVPSILTAAMLGAINDDLAGV